MIELSNVSKVFEGGTKAVDDISFAVQEDETFGLIGTSGCGKTTTLKMINRLEEPTSGRIWIEGKSILNRPAEQLRRSIGYVIQNVGLFPHYTVAQNIAITPKLLDWDSNRVEKRCEELLQLVGMNPDEFAARKPAALSGGQQQRVGLARALAADPPVILMDEPFGALDPITKERIQKEFKKLLQEIHKTIVLVTHDVFEAFDLCDRMALMNEGRMQQIGTPKELLFQPVNDFVRSFFDSHRFQLEMMSVTVADILKENSPSKGERFEPEASGSNQGDVQTISGGDSFYSVFENFHSENENYMVVDDERKPATDTTADQLFKGFQQVRRKLKENRNG